MKLSPEALARASSRHPVRTITIWLVVVISMGFESSMLLAGVLNQDFSFTNKPESVRAQDALDKTFHTNRDQDTEFVIVGSKSLTVDDPAFQEAVTHLEGQVGTLNKDLLVGKPVSYYD